MPYARDPSRCQWTLRLVLIGVCGLLLSGCIYLDLLQLKTQLGDFDRNFRVDQSVGLQIECLQPLLTPDDIRWLGIEPETTQPSGQQERWEIRWAKTRGDSTPEAADYDVKLSLVFAAGRLREIAIPQKYFEFFPKAQFLNLIRSAAHASVNRETQSATVDVQSKPGGELKTPPKLPDITAMLGNPTERNQQNGVAYLRYHFSPQSPHGTGRPIEIVFSFDEPSGSLRKLFCKLPRGSLSFDFPLPADPAPLQQN